MQRSADTAEIVHSCHTPRLRVGADCADGLRGRHLLTFSGTMCTMTVPGAVEAITRWLARAEPTEIGVHLGSVEFIDGRGVTLLVAIRAQARALGIGWSIVDAGERARDVLGICELLEAMGVEPVAG